MGLTIIVPLKRVVDPYAKIILKSDGSGVDIQHAKMVINPFDEIALEEALRWKEKGIDISSIVIVSIGSEACLESLKTGLALGADKAIHVQYEGETEPLFIAKILQKIVEKQAGSLVIMGKQAIDDDANQTGQILAGLLNWPQATYASKTTFIDNHQKIEVVREIDGGLETIEVTIPCVITTDLRLNEPRYPTLPNIMKAKQKPIGTIQINELGIAHELRLKNLTTQAPPARKPGVKLNSVEELVNALKNIEKVI
jgi:electron transfer flavoprotein beta subunit